MLLVYRGNAGPAKKIAFSEAKDLVANQTVVELRLPISSDRLERYRPVGGSDLEMLSTYVWNLALAEALQPCLQTFEVALRNGIHAALSESYGERWFEDQGLLLTREREAARIAQAALRRHNKPINPGRVVAELRFGFWTSMLSRPYENTIWHADRQRPLRIAFPNVPRRYRSRGKIWLRCDAARKLRNRVVHAEPIFDRPGLDAEHGEILESLGWISPPLRDLVLVSDRFLTIYRTGRNELREKIEEFLASATASTRTWG